MLKIRRVAVLGAGVMGAQIAAHFVNSGIDVTLYDLPATSGSPNQMVERSIQSLLKLTPAPLGLPAYADLIRAANYDDDLEQLREMDLVVEAISEQLVWKTELLQKISPFIRQDAVIATNTSGLDIGTMSKALPELIRPNYCGLHFFNPPRYMKLVELIAHPQTRPDLLDDLESFLVHKLGKGVVRAKNTPNFIGNRVGLFAVLSVMHHAQAFDLPPDIVDVLTGPMMGRSKSATYRTMDIVGLDTMSHVVRTMHDSLQTDPWHAYFKIPSWMSALVEKGALGQKTRAGVFKKEKDKIHVIDPKVMTYRPVAEKISIGGVLELVKTQGWPGALLSLRDTQEPAAQFMWAVTRDVLHYCAVHLQDIAHSVRDIDLAVRWGFGWEKGPFEVWQMAGWKPVAEAIEADRVAGITMSDAPLPKWVKDVSAVYQEGRAYSVKEKMGVLRRHLPVYERQLAPELLLNERWSDQKMITQSAVHQLIQDKEGVAVLSFKSKRNCVGPEVLEAILSALSYAQSEAKGLVIHPMFGDDFSVGADLKQAYEVMKLGDTARLEKTVQLFQQTTQAIRYAPIPVVAATKGLALGGGCEILMHCDRVVAGFESYIGLVETGVGLIPAAGGTLASVRRISQVQGGAVAKHEMLKTLFKQMAMAEVSSSALDARVRGYLRPRDTILMNPEEILYVAKAKVLSLDKQGYLPPRAQKLKVMGDTGLAILQQLLVNMKAGHMLSDHDYEVASRLAFVLCGGDVSAGSVVDEAWILALEYEAFMALTAMPKTQARVAHTIKFGKPLRN